MAELKTAVELLRIIDADLRELATQIAVAQNDITHNRRALDKLVARVFEGNGDQALVTKVTTLRKDIDAIKKRTEGVTTATVSGRYHLWATAVSGVLALAAAALAILR